MRPLILLAATLPLLAGCGGDQFSRVSTGAGTGAGTGAMIGVLGGPIGIGLGAAIGAGVGAVAGGTTTQDQIDLGKPVWRDQNAPVAQADATAPHLSHDPQYRPPGPPQPLVPGQPVGKAAAGKALCNGF